VFFYKKQFTLFAFNFRPELAVGCFDPTAFSVWILLVRAQLSGDVTENGKIAVRIEGFEDTCRWRVFTFGTTLRGVADRWNCSGLPPATALGLHWVSTLTFVLIAVYEIPDA